ncbi:MAG: protease modulator HflC [Planctomycetaceae bacterium]|nr:protease modulator HflC [Planctomycetaceae bacterium]
MTTPLPIISPPASSGKRARLAGVLLLLTVFGLYDSFFTVLQGEAVVVTRFGRPVREITTAGPFWKFPSPIDQRHVIDRRRCVFSAPESAAFTSDRRSIVVSCFVIWHVEQPLLWMQTVSDRATTEARLTSMILASANQRLGQFPLSALVSTNPREIRLAELEKQIHDEVSAVAESSMGISIDEVSIERIGLPAQNMAAVFERMRVERAAEANRLRAEGARDAQAIRDRTHVESQEILRKGREEAARISAEAERKAAEMLASSHQKDPEFYRFWSSLQASKRVLKEKATLILNSDQLFFDVFNETEGNRSSTTPAGNGEPVASPADRTSQPADVKGEARRAD